MAVQKARIYNDPAFAWDNGNPFNGYVLLVMSYPSLQGTPYTYAILNDNVQRLRIPGVYKFPIKSGFIVDDSYVWANFSDADNSISPPGVVYSPLYYDNTDRLIAIPNHNWQFTSFDQNLNVGDTFSAITPVSNLAGQGESSFGGVPTVETPTGVIDGSNTAFILSREPNGLILFRDGFGPLTSPADYMLVGATILMVVAPVNASQFKAYIF